MPGARSEPGAQLSHRAGRGRGRGRGGGGVGHGGRQCRGCDGCNRCRKRRRGLTVTLIRGGGLLRPHGIGTRRRRGRSGFVRLRGPAVEPRERGAPVRWEFDLMGRNEQGRVAAGARGAGVDATVAVGVEPGQPGERDGGRDRVDQRGIRRRANSGSRSTRRAPGITLDVRYVHAAVLASRFPARTRRYRRPVRRSA